MLVDFRPRASRFAFQPLAAALSLYPPIRSVSFFKVSYLPRQPRFLPDFANPSVSKNRVSEYTRGSFFFLRRPRSLPSRPPLPPPPFRIYFLPLRVTSFFLHRRFPRRLYPVAQASLFSTPTSHRENPLRELLNRQRNRGAPLTRRASLRARGCLPHVLPFFSSTLPVEKQSQR